MAQPVDEKKTQPAEDKTDLSVPCLEEQIDHRTELPVLVESKGTETEEDDLVGTEAQVKVEGPISADVSVIEKDIASEIACKVELEESDNDDVIIIRKESDEEVEDKLDESVIIVIQAAIRGFLV